MNNLPDGWVMATIGDTGEYINGFAFKPQHRSSDGLVIVRIQNLTNEKKPIFRTNIDVDDAYKIDSGELLVSWSATLDVFVWRKGPALVNQHIFRVVPEERLIDRGLLFYWLKKAIEDLQKTEHLHGSTMKHINRGPFMAHKIPLPPRNEQVRIVEKLEELFADLDSGVEELKKAQVKLGQYRQSLLKSAVDGSLTEQWRKEHADNITETGEQLLQRILKERRERWEQQKLAEFEAKGKKPPKDWQKKYPEPVQPYTSDLPGLPEGWTWASVDQLSLEKRYGSSSKTNDDTSGVPVLRMGNIQDGEIDYSDLKYLPVDHNEFPKLLLSDGDMLFNRTNSAELVGKTAVYRDIGRPCSYASYLISVTFSQYFLSNLAAYFINSTLGRDWILSEISQTAGQANVNGTKLGLLALPVPPLEEQKMIVAEVKKHREEIKVQLDAISTSLLQSEAQRKNILRDAFSGKLVSQDPNDEPASVLLERMREERSKQIKKERRPRKKRLISKQEVSEVIKKLEDVLAAAGDWLPAQEAFQRCGVGNGSETDQVEILYAELRALDKAGKLIVEAVTDSNGIKQYDRIKLMAEG